MLPEGPSIIPIIYTVYIYITIELTICICISNELCQSIAGNFHWPLPNPET